MLGSPTPFADRPHAYQPRYFRDVVYISDSAGYWAFGHPLNHACVSEQTGVQLLTHPYLWMRESGSVVERVDAVLHKRAQLLEAEARESFRTYGRLKRLR
jgi:hypothetical protein